MQKVLEYRNCFVCGKDSKTGLKVDFEITENRARTRCTVSSEFEGFKGIVHGGILSALLDEVMWKAINGLTGAVTMTAKMEIKYRKPVLVGTTLLVEGFILGQKRKFFETRGTLSDADGNVLAVATGLFVRLDADNAARMTEGLE